MSDTIWHIPSESMLDRLDELYKALANFSDSPSAACWQREIEYLESLLS